MPIQQQKQGQRLSVILAISLSLLLRSLIAIHHHSGQNNHHGSRVAYGGDFEAQRHWMELTIHLPLSKWYTYDTSYWGLDYPPLTAYGSFILGKLSEVIVGRESVALMESRGIEDPLHKAFMRATVIGLDCIIYIPIVYLILRKLCYTSSSTSSSIATLLLGVLIQPALVMIDHGHFQYNAVCLAFAIGSFYYMTNIIHVDNYYEYGISWNCITASIFFSLALNWKQMALYYAPAVFAYLLGRCFRSSPSSPFVMGGKTMKSTNAFNFIHVLKRITILGITVILTFGILWFPFYHYREEYDQTIMDALAIPLRRIFPFSRGLFEGKVGNIWCAASIKPLSIKERLPISIQPICALCLTLFMVLPFCILLFNVGRFGNDNIYTDCNDNTTKEAATEVQTKKKSMNHSNLHLKSLLWGSAGSSLSFFLASFQVHEKSILLPLAPLSLLVFDREESVLIHWFSIVSAWSLWHLLVVDRLQLPYVASIIVYLCYLYYATAKSDDNDGVDVHYFATSSSLTKWNLWDEMRKKWTAKVILPISVSSMIILHVLEIFVPPPTNLPDLFPVLWVVGSCISFCFMWVISLWKLFLLHSVSVQLMATYPNDESKKKDN